MKVYASTKTYLSVYFNDTFDDKQTIHTIPYNTYAHNKDILKLQPTYAVTQYRLAWLWGKWLPSVVGFPSYNIRHVNTYSDLNLNINSLDMQTSTFQEQLVWSSFSYLVYICVKLTWCWDRSLYTYNKYAAINRKYWTLTWYSSWTKHQLSSFCNLLHHWKQKE